MAGNLPDNLEITPDGKALWRGRIWRCALGRGGVLQEKREGDGATPIGSWAMRQLLYRADRQPPPSTRLSLAPIGRDDGWCDAPEDELYNRPVTLPYKASAEHLWRADEVYDLIVPLGYNDRLPKADLGSAIFLHVARPDYAPTAGCVALSQADLLTLLAEADPRSRVVVRGP